MSDRLPQLVRGESYEEALAHWQLHVQTAVKKASSLPTAMFDACDATLEARLTAATEGLFQLLLEHDAPPSDEALAAELHLEDVRPDELRELQRELANPPATSAPDLSEGSRAEHLGILTDLACTGEGSHQTRAAQALAGSIDSNGLQDLDQLASRLVDDLAHTLCSPATPADPGFEDTCRKIVGGVLTHLRRAQDVERAR